MFLQATVYQGELYGSTLGAVLLLFLALFLAALLLFLVRRRYRARQAEIMVRVTELAALSEAGRALVESQLDVRALSELIAAEAGKIIDTRTFQLGLFKGDLYQIVYWTVDGKRRPPTLFDLGDDGGLVGWVREHREPLLIADFDTELNELPARPRYLSDTPPLSGLFLPLISGDETLGIIAAQSSEPAHFSQDDVRRLTILANQAAAAIANARLYEAERTRAAHLELVGEIAQTVNASQDLEELFEVVVQQTCETFGFHPVSIFSVQKPSGDAIIQASSAGGIEAGDVCVPAGMGLIGSAVAARQTVISNNTAEDERFIGSVQGFPGHQTRSEIIIPLIVDSQLLGVLDVQSNVPGAFTAQEQTVLEALAAQTATAIHKMRQIATQREQAWVTTAQLQVADAIRQSSGLEELLEAITRLVPLLVGVDTCTILLWNQELRLYEGVAAHGFPPQVEERFHRIELPIGSWGALDAVHVGMMRLSTNRLPPWCRDAATEEREEQWILYPLVAKGQMTGVIVVDEPPPPSRTLQAEASGGFGERQDEMLRNIANQTAQAVESEQSHIAQQEEAWVNTALLQVAEAVNSLIDLNEILSTIIRFIPMLVGVESCLILIYDEETDSFYAGPSYGLDEMERGLLESFAIEASELPPMEPLDVSPPTPGTTIYRVKLPPWMRDVMGTESANVLPLYARNRLVGALLVGPPTSQRPLLGRRLQILTGIAQQAAIAVVNDQLYREAAERNQLEKELDLAHQIQASFIPHGSPDIAGCTVASFWQAARQVSGDFYDFLELPDGRWGIVVADVADKGVPAALFMALCRTVLRTIAFGRHEPAPTLERANRLIWNDTTSDLFVTVFYAIWDPATETLVYANAGHNPPLLLRASGKSSLLHGDGIALGVLESVAIEQREVRLKPGDLVLFYTDGVTEAVNEDYDEFGLERLRLTAAATRRREAPAIMAAITEALDEHAGGTAQSDDVTLVVMKRHEQLTRQSA